MLRPTAVTADPAWLDTDANLSQAVVCISVCVSAPLITHNYWDNSWKSYTFNIQLLQTHIHTTIFHVKLSQLVLRSFVQPLVLLNNLWWHDVLLAAYSTWHLNIIFSLLMKGLMLPLHPSNTSTKANGTAVDYAVLLDHWTQSADSRHTSTLISHLLSSLTAHPVEDRRLSWP